MKVLEKRVDLSIEMRGRIEVRINGTKKAV
jgi:hypothetical protein